MTIASDLFRTVTVKIHDISQQLPYIVVNQADDNGKIIRFVPMDHGQKVTGFTGARLYYPPRSDAEYGDYVTGVESDGAWDFTIPVGVLRAGRVGCNLAFIDGDGETYSRNVVFLVEPAVSGVFDPEDGQQTRLDKIIGTVQTAADTAIDSINNTVDDAMESIGKAEESISESVTEARGYAEAAANSAQQAAVSASAAQTSERNAADSATAAAESKDAAKASETAAAQSAQTTTEQVSSIGDSVERAAASATAASQSASQAQSSATAANSSAQAAAVSAESAQTATESAASSKDAAARSASEASESAQAAEASKTNAASSASAAEASKTNAAASASAAKTSETNAAASATAAQQAVDGFGLEVGTTTTGDPGTDAAVSIAKQGTKYVADFTIPRGEKGEQGASGINSVLTNTTLTGDGTSSSPLGISPGTFINPISVSGDGADANLVEAGKIYVAHGGWKNLPNPIVGGYLFYITAGVPNVQFLIAYTDDGGGPNVYIRQSWGGVVFAPWRRLIRDFDLSRYVPLSTYQSLETRVQALEAKLSNQ